MAEDIEEVPLLLSLKMPVDERKSKSHPLRLGTFIVVVRSQG